MDQRNRAFGSNNNSGRIILLGDGSEVLTDSDDTEMFDHDEDKDLASQVHKGQTATSQSKPADAVPEKLSATESQQEGAEEKLSASSTGAATTQ
jgi:protein phosphatase 2C family protein 2/3